MYDYFYKSPIFKKKYDEFDYLEKGLIQRVDALNAFLRDVYSDKKIIKLIKRALYLPMLLKK